LIKIKKWILKIKIKKEETGGRKEENGEQKEGTNSETSGRHVIIHGAAGYG
jgi:hypothetical protein